MRNANYQLKPIQAQGEMAEANFTHNNIILNTSIVMDDIDKAILIAHEGQHLADYQNQRPYDRCNWEIRVLQVQIDTYNQLVPDDNYSGDVVKTTTHSIRTGLAGILKFSYKC